MIKRQSQKFLQVLFVLLVLTTLIAGHAAAQDCPPATAVTGSIDGTEATQDGRIFRDGTASTCAGKTYPGVSLTGTPILYETYTYQNVGSQNACVTVNFNSTNGSGQHVTFLSAYLNSYDPNDKSLNYLGDEGSSPDAFSGVPNSFSFTVPANQDLVLVVNTTNNTSERADYSFTISGMPCQIQSVPTLSEWGMIIFIALAGAGSLYFMRRQKKLEN
jgi:hypothetical protein